MRVLIASSERMAGGLILSLQKAGHEVVGVLSPRKGLWSSQSVSGGILRFRGWDTMSACKKFAIPFRVASDIFDGSMTAFIKQCKADVLVLFGWPHLVPDSVTRLFPFGAMNIHPSLLPKMRGPDPLFTTIDEDREGFGLSFHKAVAELDAGNLYLQVPLQRHRRDTYDTLYRKVLVGVSRNLPRALNLMKNNPEGSPQKGVPDYVKPFRQKHRVLDLDATFEKNACRTRACFAHHTRITAYNGILLHFSSMKQTAGPPDADRKLGAIQRVGLFSLTVQLRCGSVLLQGIRIDGKPKWMTPFLIKKLIKPGGKLAPKDTAWQRLKQARTGQLHG